MPSDDCNDAEIAALMADDSCLSAATPARTPVNAGVPSETPKRRRGRPCANPIGEAASWTAEMIEILLEQKTTFARASADARNNDAVQLGWNRLALSVNTILHANFSSKQIKDKYANLATLYRKIKEAENETGNKTPKKKPLYWKPINSHFGGRQGAAHSNLLLEDDGIIAQEPARDEEGTFGKGDVTLAKKRKAVVTDRLNAVTSVGSEIKQAWNLWVIR